MATPSNSLLCMHKSDNGRCSHVQCLLYYCTTALAPFLLPSWGASPRKNKVVLPPGSSFHFESTATPKHAKEERGATSRGKRE